MIPDEGNSPSIRHLHGSEPDHLLTQQEPLLEHLADHALSQLGRFEALVAASAADIRGKVVFELK